MGVKIMTDSTSYIDESVRNKLDIKTLSLYVSFTDESIKEIEIENKVFYEKMEQDGIPVSSQPAIGELYQSMVDIVSKGDDLLCIFLSSDMSGTYNSACKVKDKVLEEYKDRDIHILDSRSNSMQLGFAAIVAARAAMDGKDIEEIKKIAEENFKRSRFLFIPDNLKYLKKGGRIGGAGALIGNVLKIIPILTVKDGNATIFKKVRTKVKAVKSMVDKLLEDNLKYGIKEVVIHHINCYEEAKELAIKLEKKLNINIPIESIGPVIGLHVGPGAVGIAYYTEDELID
ncbi:DegV family protein [Tissierella creatinophila]|uniref:Fatty acid-binding protein n=1 Tax=Tissierella creatinophila DSM 6911 TaxID=1123403 RepID=A0A1U7M2L6_TISCR|nr:DegV family protein [Tissierella creatinophila]OLS01459.1 fatty acid-binding protein [Tissierella creatinophila DSM 6911]